jgi:hypothetical protein
MAYGDDVDDGVSADHPGLDGATHSDGAVDDGEGGTIDLASSDLPDFLTQDEPVAAGVALNGASAP